MPSDLSDAVIDKAVELLAAEFRKAGTDDRLSRFSAVLADQTRWLRDNDYPFDRRYSVFHNLADALLRVAAREAEMTEADFAGWQAWIEFPTNNLVTVIDGRSRVEYRHQPDGSWIQETVSRAA